MKEFSSLVTARIVTPSAEEVYRARCERFAGERDAQTRAMNRVANLRLLAFLAATLCLGWGLWRRVPPLWIAGCGLLLVFVALVVLYARLNRARRRNDELWRINDEAGKRLARTWDELPLRHTARAQPGHSYAADLDIYGHASLLQLLETPGTSMGEATLAAWLGEPSPVEQVRVRQGAVAELAPMIDLRDELQLGGRLMGHPKPDPAPFLAWAEGGPWLARRHLLVWAARTGAVAMWLLILAQLTGLTSFPARSFGFTVSVLALVNIGLSVVLAGEAYNILERVNLREGAFHGYAGLLQLISEARFSTPALKAAQATLDVAGTPAHRQMRRMHTLGSLVLPRSSLLYVLAQGLFVWDVHVLWTFERWQTVAGSHARSWLRTLGEVEAVAALSVLKHDNPNWAFPDLDPRAQSLQARGLGHPLLPTATRVSNDAEVGPAGTFLLVTGSNMSGKSTLLRAIGVNIVLAQAGGPVCARALRLPPVELWTSMRLEDSLESGVSYFMVELQRLKQVVDASRRCHAEGGRRLFYLLDEILSGTNTFERQVAARRIIAHFVVQGALGAVSTHDLTLAEAEEIRELARHVHFTETIDTVESGPVMSFDYKLRPGLATSTNALRLMEIVGLDLDGPD